MEKTIEMNPAHASRHACPHAAVRSNRLAIALLATILPIAGCSNSPDSRNESHELLRSVPLPMRAVAIGRLGELDLQEGQVLRHQTYTISPEGEFTLDRLIESEVGAVGATFAALTPAHAERLEMEPFAGVYVRSVRGKGPLSRAGVRARDAILSFAGEAVISRDHLAHLVETARPGTEVTVEYNHDGEIAATTVEIASESRTESIRALHRQLPVLDDRARSGMKIVELPEDIHSMVHGEETGQGGLLVLEMLPGGPAFFSDLRVRDLITAVDGKPVTTRSEYSSALDAHEAGQRVPFQARRDRDLIETTVTLDQDATASSGFNLLNLVKYRKRPEEREFSMIWEILFRSGKSYSVVKHHNVGQHTTSSSWGAFLDLLRYRRSPRKTQFDFLWILPITIRHDEES